MRIKTTNFLCIAHTLNLTVRKALMLVKNLLEKCKKIAGHFNHSVQHREKLVNIQMTVCKMKSELMPIQEVISIFFEIIKPGNSMELTVLFYQTTCRDQRLPQGFLFHRRESVPFFPFK